jgi:hypothetical protein
MRIKEILLFLLVGIIFSSSMAYGAWTKSFTKTASVVTSGVTQQLTATGVVTSEQASNIAIQGLNGGIPKGVWRVGGRLFGIIGIGFLVYDIYTIVQEMRSEPGMVKKGTEGLQGDKTIPLSNGKHIHIVRTYSQTYTPNRPHAQSIKIVLSGTLQAPIATITKEGSRANNTKNPNTESGYHVWVDDFGGYDNNKILEYYDNDYGYDLIIQNNIQGLTVDTSQFPADQTNEELARQWVLDHPGDFEDPNKINITLDDESPSGAYDMGDANTGVTDKPTSTDTTQTDPKTNEDLSPVTANSGGLVANSGGLGTMTSPGLPGSSSAFDTSIELPQIKSIGELVTGFLNNAPFMNVINNFSVEASSGSSSLSFSLYGRQISWDFAQYEYFYNMMAAVLLSLAYIWAVQIVFGGRA